MKNIFIVVLLILLSGVGVFIYTNVKNNDLPSNEKVTYTNNLLGYSVVLPDGYEVAEEYTKFVNQDLELGSITYEDKVFDIQLAEIIVFSPDTIEEQLETISRALSYSNEGKMLTQEPDYIYIEPDPISPEIRNRLEERIQEINPKDEDGFRLANVPLMFGVEKVQERITKTVLLEETKKYYVHEGYSDTGYQEVYGLDIVVPNNNEAKQIVAKMIDSLEY